MKNTMRKQYNAIVRFEGQSRRPGNWKNARRYYDIYNHDALGPAYCETEQDALKYINWCCENEEIRNDYGRVVEWKIQVREVSSWLGIGMGTAGNIKIDDKGKLYVD